MLKSGIVIFVIGIVLFALLLIFLEQFSQFGANLLNVGIAISLFAALDKFVLKDIDTIKELKDGNIAYALFLLSLAVLIAAALIG